MNLAVRKVAIKYTRNFGALRLPPAKLGDGLLQLNFDDIAAASAVVML